MNLCDFTKFLNLSNFQGSVQHQQYRAGVANAPLKSKQHRRKNNGLQLVKNEVYCLHMYFQSDLKKLVKPKFKFQRGHYFMGHIDESFYFSKKIWSLFYGTYIVLFQQKKRFLRTCIYTYQKNETFWYVVNYFKYPILVFIHSDSEILLLLKTPRQ